MAVSGFSYGEQHVASYSWLLPTPGCSLLPKFTAVVVAQERVWWSATD